MQYNQNRIAWAGKNSCSVALEDTVIADRGQGDSSVKVMGPMIYSSSPSTLFFGKKEWYKKGNFWVFKKSKSDVISAKEKTDSLDIQPKKSFSRQKSSEKKRGKRFVWFLKDIRNRILLNKTGTNTAVISNIKSLSEEISFDDSKKSDLIQDKSTKNKDHSSVFKIATENQPAILTEIVKNDSPANIAEKLKLFGSFNAGKGAGPISPFIQALILGKLTPECYKAFLAGDRQLYLDKKELGKTRLEWITQLGSKELIESLFKKGHLKDYPKIATLLKEAKERERAVLELKGQPQGVKNDALLKELMTSQELNKVVALLQAGTDPQACVEMEYNRPHRVLKEKLWHYLSLSAPLDYLKKCLPILVAFGLNINSTVSNDMADHMDLSLIQFFVASLKELESIQLLLDLGADPCQSIKNLWFDSNTFKGDMTMRNQAKERFSSLPNDVIALAQLVKFELETCKTGPKLSLQEKENMEAVIKLLEKHSALQKQVSPSL